MRFSRYFLAGLSVLCLSVGLSLQPPYSPTQELPPVAYTAFEVSAPSESAGKALAQAALGWPGVTAGSYNSGSGLLVISHTKQASVSTLQQQLHLLSGKPVNIKTFPEQMGPKCPVPLAALAAVPRCLIAIGVALGLTVLLLPSFRKSPIPA